MFKDSYSIQKVYMATFQLQPKTNWSVLVWNRVAIPRACFCCQLMALEKLKSKYILHCIGVTPNDLCPLCAETKESNQHMHFECPFSQRCLDEIEKWRGVRFKHIVSMNFRKYKLKKVQQQIMSAIYTFVVYAIWKSRTLLFGKITFKSPILSYYWLKKKLICV